MFLRTLSFALLASVAVATAPAGPLQDRVDALAQQIHLRYQHHTPSLSEHRETVSATLEAWNQAAAASVSDPRISEFNRGQMTAWLDAALTAVMPGGSGHLPRPPAFEQPAVAEPVAETAPTPSPTTSVAEDDQAAGPAMAPANPRGTTDPAPPAVAKASAQRPNPEAAKAPEMRSQFVGPRASRRAAAKPVTPEPTERAITAPKTERSKWSQHPSAAPLEWRDPFADDPAASPNPLRSGARREALRPTFIPATSARVDVRLLAAEVRGYNAALRDLQTRVLRLAADDILGLAAAAGELEHLAERRQFLDLYREGLSTQDRRALPDSPSAELVHELVRRKADALSRNPPSLPAERRALEQLNARLAGLSRAVAGSF